MMVHLKILIFLCNIFVVLFELVHLWYPMRLLEILLTPLKQELLLLLLYLSLQLLYLPHHPLSCILHVSSTPFDEARSTSFAARRASTEYVDKRRASNAIESSSGGSKRVDCSNTFDFMVSMSQRERDSNSGISFSEIL